MDDPNAKPDEVSPEWITSVLRQKGVLDRGHAVAVRTILSRTLHVSRVSRLEIDYSATTPPSVPRKLFLKRSLLTGENRVQTGIDQPEVEFYNSVAQRMPSEQLISCYHASFSAETGDSAILMEDLSDTHFQSPQREAPLQQCSRLAVECLARFHAYWWNDPLLGTEIGKVFGRVWLERFLADLETSVAGFQEFLGNGLSTSRRETYRKMLAAAPNIWGRLCDPSGLTVTHGDMHWWNFLFPNDLSADQMKIFDWQLWHIDQGPRDLAFLLALGGFAERRPELDRELVRLYYDTLVSSGVRNYTWDEFWMDYRMSAIRNLNIPVIFWTQGKHPHTWNSMLNRAFEAYEEMGCEECL